jgi:hypothetical protein
MRGLRAIHADAAPDLVADHEGLTEQVTIRVTPDVLTLAEELADRVTPPNRMAVLREAITRGLRDLRREAKV